jgi:glutamate transport system permease protein
MDAIIENLPTFLGGFWNTLQLLVYSGLASLVLGTVIAAMRISPVAALRAFATVYTEILRNIPLTLVLSSARTCCRTSASAWSTSPSR